MNDLALRSDLLLRMEEGEAVDAVSLDLSMRPNLTMGEFASVCEFVGKLGSAQRWWVGDLVNQGERRFGEDVYQALEGLQMSPEGRMECARVAVAFHRSQRRPGLSWGHHRAVAARWIGPDRREQLLDRAEGESWGVRELAQAVRDLRALESGLHVEDVKACDELADIAVRDLREELISCGYPSDVQVSVDVAAPGVTYTVAVGGV
jgi:hypothetical protein